MPAWGWIISFPDKWILMGAGMMFCVGLADDILNLKAKIKLGFQCLAAVLVVAAGFRFHLPFLHIEELGMFNDWIAAAITFLWIVGIINAVNLMDGMDGLAAGMGVIAISSLTVALAMSGYGPDIVLVTAFIAAMVGFLLFNSHPASIFMGDSGSLFLGFILATFSLPAPGTAVGGLAYLIPILALGLPILDTLTAIFRRMAQGKGIFTADRDHIHHRVLRAHSNRQRSTVLTLYAVNITFGLMAILVLTSKTAAIVALVLSLTGLLCLLFLVKLGYIVIPQDEKAAKQDKVIDAKLATTEH
jgi:UDP-GlcNAc:undecaprenyl-phosphate GlcNAc-1-phosphate transferase